MGSLSQEKDIDLASKLYSLVTKLSRQQQAQAGESEALVDECLMLPHKVLIPALDTVVSPVGVLSCLPSLSPLSSSGWEGVLSSPPSGLIPS